MEDDALFDSEFVCEYFGIDKKHLEGDYMKEKIIKKKD
jgi:hypothetical protein